jgi:hypothetical protein
MSNENKDTEIFVENEQSSKVQATSNENSEKKKDKQEKRKRVFRSEWLTEFKFLKAYKSDKSQATCMACNSQFSVHHGGKKRCCTTFKE